MSNSPKPNSQTTGSQIDLVKTTWWLVRHGPVLNPGNLIYGKADYEIQTDNPALYRPLAKTLPRDAIYLTSSLKRTIETLMAVSQTGGFAPPEFIQNQAFDEQSFGDWEGRSWNELFKTGQTHDFWLAPARETPPGGESFEDVMARVANGLDYYNRLYTGRQIVLFAHGGTIRAALAYALRLSGETALQFSIDNCSLTQINHLQLPDGSESWHIDHINIAPTRPIGFCPS